MCVSAHRAALLLLLTYDGLLVPIPSNLDSLNIPQQWNDAALAAALAWCKTALVDSLHIPWQWDGAALAWLQDRAG